jgi:hypothetical protein
MHPEINKAIAAHGQWKSKFNDFMSGKTTLDAATVGLSNHCDFGKWLEHEGKSVLGQALSDVTSLHADFHKKAAAVVRMKTSGDVKGAQASLGIGGEFSAASAGLTRKLMELASK